MQADGGLVQDVEGVAVGPLAQLAGELDPLGLPGEGRGRLPQAEIAQADVVQELELGPMDGMFSKKVSACRTVGSRTSAMFLPL